MNKLIRAVLLGAAVASGVSSSLAQTNFATLVNDGAWTWFNDPRAVFYGSNLFFAYDRNADGESLLSVLNLQTGVVSNLFDSSRTLIDDHFVSGMLIKEDGTMLDVYSRHQNDQFFMYRLSTTTNPATSADWGAEQTNNTQTNVATGMTYSNPYQLSAEGGRIYNFGRYINYNPNVFTSSDGGNTWSTPTVLILTSASGVDATRPYVKYCSDYNSRIDFIYTDAHPDNYTTSLYHMYYQGSNFYMSDGTFLKAYTNLPILHDDGERGTVIYQYSASASTNFDQWIQSGRVWGWEIAYQTNGNPVCVYQAKVDNVTGTNWYDARCYYYYASWTGTNWQNKFIAQAGRPLYDGQPDYGGGMALDPQDPTTIYISTDAANPFVTNTVTNVPLGNNYEIWKGVTADGGLTFAWTSVTGNSSVDNMRPYIPRRFGGQQCVLWFRGTYTSYTSFSTAVVGLFTSAIPQAATGNGTWNADASGVWSDTTKWLGGTVADGAGNTGDFSTISITADRTVTLDTSRTLDTLRFGYTGASNNWFVSSSGASTLTLSDGNTNSPSIVVNTNTVTIEATLAGANGFTKSQPGTLILAASNSLSGILNLDRGIDGNNNDGATQITSSNAIANVSSIIIRNTSVAAAGGATFQLNGSGGNIIVPQPIGLSCRNNTTSPTVENIAGTNTLSGTTSVQVGGSNLNYQLDAGLLQITGPISYVGTLTAARTYTFAGAGNATVSGAIANGAAPIGIVKTGTGTLTLSGPDTYTNGTTVSGGTLQVNGTLANAKVTVTSGGTLSGTGTIAGPVTIAAGGTLAPGGSAIGTLTVNNTLTNSGVTSIRLSKTGSVLTNDTLKGVTTLGYGGTLSLSNIGPGILTVSNSFKIFTATTYKGLFASLSPATPGPGLLWNTNNLSSGTLSIALGTVHPQFSQASLSGTNVVFGGSGGAAGYGYSIVSSTNVAAPLNSWNLTGSGVCDGSGNFVFTNTLNSQAPQQYYAIHIP